MALLSASMALTSGMAQAPVLRGVAGPGFQRYRQTHFRNRYFKIAFHIHREGFERRNVKCVETFVGAPWLTDSPLLKFNKRGKESAKCFPTACRSDKQGGASLKAELHQFELVRPRLPASYPEPSIKNRRQPMSASGQIQIQAIIRVHRANYSLLLTLLAGGICHSWPRCALRAGGTKVLI